MPHGFVVVSQGTSSICSMMKRLMVSLLTLGTTLCFVGRSLMPATGPTDPRPVNCFLLAFGRFFRLDRVTLSPIFAEPSQHEPSGFLADPVGAASWKKCP